MGQACPISSSTFGGLLLFKRQLPIIPKSWLLLLLIVVNNNLQYRKVETVQVTTARGMVQIDWIRIWREAFARLCDMGIQPGAVLVDRQRCCISNQCPDMSFASTESGCFFQPRAVLSPGVAPERNADDVNPLYYSP